MAGRKPEPLDASQDLELKTLKLDLIDLVSPPISISKIYTPYLAMCDEKIEALVGLPLQEKRKALNAIAQKIIASCQN